MLQIIQSESETVFFVEIFQFIGIKILETFMRNHRIWSLFSRNFENEKIFFLTFHFIDQQIFDFRKVVFGNTEQLHQFSAAHLRYFVFGKQSNTLLRRIGTLIVLPRQKFGGKMKFFCRIFLVKNIGNRIYKSIVNHLCKLVFIQSENIVHIINFNVLNGGNDIFYFIKNFRTFNIKNSSFFYENSFVHHIC